MFFWNSPAFLMIHQMLTTRSLVPLPFLNPSWTSVHGILQARILEWVALETKIILSFLRLHPSSAFQARLQQYVNDEFPDVQAGFRKGRRHQRSNCQHPLDHRKSKTVPEKHLLLLHWLCQSLWLCGSQQTGKFLEMGIPDHLICLLRNLYVGQEATVRTRHATDWF